MARRHKVDIFAEVLRLAKNGAKLTRLVYQANLNFTIIRKHLQALTEHDLIESINGHTHTTEKGLEFLEKYEEMIVALKSIDYGVYAREVRA